MVPAVLEHVPEGARSPLCPAHERLDHHLGGICARRSEGDLAHELGDGRAAFVTDHGRNLWVEPEEEVVDRLWGVALAMPPGGIGVVGGLGVVSGRRT